MEFLVSNFVLLFVVAAAMAITSILLQLSNMKKMASGGADMMKTMLDADPFHAGSGVVDGFEKTAGSMFKRMIPVAVTGVLGVLCGIGGIVGVIGKLVG